MNDRDPSANQTKEEITNYYKDAKIGDAACIRFTHGGMLFLRMTVIKKAAAKSRIATRDPYPYGGCGWYVDGRNSISPKGQGSLVKPTPEIEAWIKRNHGCSSNWR